jgi:hypothetical protein
MDGIKETIFKFLKIDNLVENLSGYLESRVKLLKIEIQEDVAKVLSKGLVHVTIVFFAFLFLIFFSIGLAEYINTFFINSFEGYWIVSGIYLIIFLIFLAFRKNLDKVFEKYFSELIKQKDE